MKKTFYILFAIYFVALAAMPCEDKDDCNELKQTETSQTEHKEKESDKACTPFCVCSCCAAHFLVKDFYPVLDQVEFINTIYTIHKESKTSTAIIPIWQPPKLA